jgi:hypothetical protein
MKNIIKSFWSICESIGTARAAAFLARQGRVAEAKALYGN